MRNNIMAKYHINYMGEPGICRAQFNCPFGGEQDHYGSKTEARDAYETHMVTLEEARKPSLYSPLDDASPSSNSSWNKWQRKAKRIVVSDTETPKSHAEALRSITQEMGPQELVYLAGRNWPNPLARMYAREEINNREEAAE